MTNVEIAYFGLDRLGLLWDKVLMECIQQEESTVWF